MKNVFQYTQTIHNTLVAAKCIMVVNGNQMTTSDINRWFDDSVNLTIRITDSTYEFVPGAFPAVLYDKFNHTAYHFTTQTNYPKECDMSISYSQATALTGNFVVNTRLHVEPHFDVTAGILQGLTNKHITMTINNAAAKAGDKIVAGNIVVLHALTGYRFQEQYTAFEFGSAKLTPVYNTDKTVATFTMRLPNNTTTDFWNILGTGTEQHYADVTTKTINRNDTATATNSHYVMTINGIPISEGMVIHAGDRVVITMDSGYVFSANRTSGWTHNPSFRMNNPTVTNASDIDPFDFTINTERTIATGTVPVLTNGRYWSDQYAFTISDTERAPATAVNTYTVINSDRVNIINNGVSDSGWTANGKPITVGQVLHAGDAIKLVADAGQRFKLHPNTDAGEYAAILFYKDAKGSYHLYNFNFSADRTVATLTFPALPVGATWYDNAIFFIATEDIPVVNSYTLTQNDIDILTANKVKLVVNNRDAVVGTVINSTDPVYGKTTGKNWEFYNPHSNVVLKLENTAGTSLALEIDPADSTQTKVGHLPTFTDPYTWKGLDALNVNTRVAPFDKKTWLNIYTITESDLVRLKRDLAINSTISTGPKINYSDYVVSLVELPYEIPSYVRLLDTTISIWDYNSAVPGEMFSEGILRYDLGTISVPMPDTPTLGYHSTAKLFLPRFPEIELDINLVFGYNIRVEYLVNLETGVATVNVYSDNPNTRNGAVLSQTANWNISVPWNATNWGSITNTEIPLNEENNIVTPYIEIETQETIQSNIFTVPILTNEKFNIANKGYYEVEQVKFLAQGYNMSAADREDFIAALKDGFILE